MIARGESRPVILDALCRLVEELPAALCRRFSVDQPADRPLRAMHALNIECSDGSVDRLAVDPTAKSTTESRRQFFDETAQGVEDDRARLALAIISSSRFSPANNSSCCLRS